MAGGKTREGMGAALDRTLASASLPTMPQLEWLGKEAGESRLRLQTAVRLRWFGVAGQLATVSFVRFGLGFQFDIGICLALIALSAWLNVFLRMRYPARTRLSASFATILLAYDILQLAALLYLTGGIENPFVFLIVAPVTVSAATLPPPNTIALGVLAALATTALAFFGRPLPWAPPGSLDLPTLYSVGVLASVLSGMLFLALYAWRLAKESRQMADALSATEMVLAREQQLHALDGLAAAAAHELGTPLSTISVVAKELARGAPVDGSFADDLALLQSQAERCREILRKLTRGTQQPDPLLAQVTVRELIEEAAAPYRGYRTKIVISAAPEAGERRGRRARGRAPAGRPLRHRQPGRERRRFRARDGGDYRHLVGAGGGHHHRRRRAWGIAAGVGRPWRALRHDAAGAARRPGRRLGQERQAARHGARLLHRQDAAGAVRSHGLAGQPAGAGDRCHRQDRLAPRGV